MYVWDGLVNAVCERPDLWYGATWRRQAEVKHTLPHGGGGGSVLEEADLISN